MFAIDAIGYKNKDTLRALLFYYLLCPLSNRHAHDWWELTYAKYIFPKAQLASQRISEVLADVGSEDAKRKFFKKYFEFLEKRDSATDEEIGDGIVIDSTGLPNAIRFQLTAVNNHNGKISEEIRLIYVIQQSTGLPIFFRYVAGNIIDATTITRTIAELKANGINTKFAILDAGYYNGKNADVLMDAGVSFISRMDSNYKVYKRLVKNYLAELEKKENLVSYNNRLLYIKCFPCHIGAKEDRHAYAYLCRDLAMKHELEKKLIERAEDQDLPTDEIFDTMQTQGVFVLISSRKIARNKLLPLYYTRDRVEKIFELCKQGAKILPINVETEASFRGHLMLTFMATSIIKMMSDKLEGTSLTLESVFMHLHEQHAIIYDDVIVTTEPNKKMKEAYKAFGIECPETLKNELKESVAL
jgi:transposase